MRVTVQRKRLSGDRRQMQLSYTINGARRQVVVPNTIYQQGSRADERAAERIANRAAAELQRKLSGEGIAAIAMRYAESITGTKRIHLQRVATLWEQYGLTDAPISALTAYDVKQFCARVVEYKPNTRRSYIAQLCWIIGQERQQGRITAEQADRLTTAATKPAPERDNRPYIDPADLDRLLATPAPVGVNPLYIDVWLLSYYTGLRYSDIRQLTADNIGADCIRLAQRKTGEVVSVPLNDNARRILARHPKLFASLSEQTTLINRAVAKWAAWARVEASHTNGRKSIVTIHTARHTCATVLLNKGVPIEQVSALLGHRSITTTQVYAKIVSSTLSAAVALL